MSGVCGSIIHLTYFGGARKKHEDRQIDLRLATAGLTHDWTLKLKRSKAASTENCEQHKLPIQTEQVLETHATCSGSISHEQEITRRTSHAIIVHPSSSYFTQELVTVDLVLQICLCLNDHGTLLFCSLHRRFFTSHASLFVTSRPCQSTLQTFGVCRCATTSASTRSTPLLSSSRATLRGMYLRPHR